MKDFRTHSKIFAKNIAQHQDEIFKKIIGDEIFEEIKKTGKKPDNLEIEMPMHKSGIFNYQGKVYKNGTSFISIDGELVGIIKPVEFKKLTANSLKLEYYINYWSKNELN